MDAASASAVLSRVQGTTDLKFAAGDADFVIEAVLEVMNIKKQVLKELDALCKPETVIASNTSGLSITEMASATARPDRIIGMHFFNPVPVMKLVELIRVPRKFAGRPRYVGPQGVCAESSSIRPRLSARAIGQTA